MNNRLSLVRDSYIQILETAKYLYIRLERKPISIGTARNKAKWRDIT